ncbi:unnamed protein product [Allacma fusca]|uniref:DUF5641 domain-containing protein n=1 Tax=Allacma fusca TaxID=39272 RepID=A0A8J2P263_9HEXA|nr:unnamed protein product [Allacma fusca]
MCLFAGHHNSGRTKGTRPLCQISSHPDDLTALTPDERLPSQQWHLARIIKTHPGDDGKVRVVTIKSGSGEFKQPITKLCALPFENEEEDWRANIVHL